MWHISSIFCSESPVSGSYVHGGQLILMARHKFSKFLYFISIP